jgi:hypothetical protein
MRWLFVASMALALASRGAEPLSLVEGPWASPSFHFDPNRAEGLPLWDEFNAETFGFPAAFANGISDASGALIVAGLDGAYEFDGFRCVPLIRW